MAFKDFAVSTSFKAKDKMTKGFKAMGRGAKKFAATAVASFKRATRAASTFKSVTGGILAAGAISRGLRVLTGGIGSVVTQFIAFDKAALGATVRFTDIGPKAADFNEQLKKIEKSARDAGATTQFTAAQAAEALNFLAKAGFTSTEAMLGLESMINLSIATGEDFNSVADQSSDLLGSFGLAANDAATKIKNLNRLNDVLVKTSNSANVTMETMFDTMKIAAPIGTNLGISLEETAAVVGVLGASGIKGSQAATALKNAFLNLTTGKSKVVGMLKEIGAEIKTDTKGNFLFTDTLDEITKKTKGMGKLKRIKVFEQIFGKFAIAGALNLGNAIDKIKDLEKALKAAGGESKLTAEIMSRSLEAKLLVLTSTATEFGFKILEVFRGDAKGGIDELTASIRDFDPAPIITAIEDIITTFKVLAPIVKGVFDFISTLAKITGVVAAEIFTFIEGGSAGGAISGPVFGEDFEQERVPPNQEEAAARQEVNFQGRIDLNGFPPGTTTETNTTGAPDIDMAILGGP